MTMTDKMKKVIAEIEKISRPLKDFNVTFINKKKITIDTDNVIVLDSLNYAIQSNDTNLLKNLKIILTSNVIRYWLYCNYDKDQYKIPLKVIKEIPIVLLDNNVMELCNLMTSYNKMKQNIALRIVRIIVYNTYMGEYMEANDSNIIKYILEDVNSLLNNKEIKHLSDNEKWQLLSSLEIMWSDTENKVRNLSRLYLVRCPIIQSIEIELFHQL